MLGAKCEVLGKGVVGRRREADMACRVPTGRSDPPEYAYVPRGY